MCLGRKFLYLFMIPDARAIFEEILLMCEFQFKCWSIDSPKKLKVDTCSKSTPSMVKFSLFIFFLGEWKIIYFDLVALRDSLFSLSQEFTFSSAVLIESVREVGAIVLSVVERVVSSAYIMKEKREL